MTRHLTAGYFLADPLTIRIVTHTLALLILYYLLFFGQNCTGDGVNEPAQLIGFGSKHFSNALFGTVCK